MWVAVWVPWVKKRKAMAPMIWWFAVCLETFSQKDSDTLDFLILFVLPVNAIAVEISFVGFPWVIIWGLVALTTILKISGFAACAM